MGTGAYSFNGAMMEAASESLTSSVMVWRTASVRATLVSLYAHPLKIESETIPARE